MSPTSRSEPDCCPRSAMPAAGITDELVFFVNGKKIVEKNADPEQMLLPYLRKNLRLTGTKYSCGVGGCGSCTVMVSTFDPSSKEIRHFSAVACLIPICSLDGMAITTVEGIGSTKTRLHPVQERIAKSHGSQCGFCTPGMVMSMYTLLRNHPDPTMEQILEALGGNLCRCTGYRPIIDGCKTFSSGCCGKKDKSECCMDPVGGPLPLSEDDKVSKKLKIEGAFLPFDPTQELIFPPELMIMVRDQKKKKLFFQGERMTWISPATLAELLDLKAKYPKAPLVVGNTSVGLEMKMNGVFYPVLISPVKIPDLTVVTFTDEGLSLGAACNLTLMKNILKKAIADYPDEKTKTFQAVLDQLKTLGGEQIRNVASLGGHIVSRNPTSDLNPILAVGNSILNLASKGGNRQIPLDEAFFAATSPLKQEEIVVSILIPFSKKWEHVLAFRQSMRRENASAFVNAGVRVLFKAGTDTIEDFNIFYGGMGPTTVSARRSCQKLIGRPWNEETLSKAYKNILDEVTLPGSASGGMVDYRRSLTLSFLFKFYLQTLLELKKMNVFSSQDIPRTFLSATKPFQEGMPQSMEIYQEVPPNQPEEDPVGRPIPHLSSIKQATGEAVYVDDIPAVDRELFMTFVTSTRAYAKILKIDAAEALKLPGVVDVITAKDVPGSNLLNEDEEVFASEKVICIGQAVAAVVADTQAHAKLAAAKVIITYEDLHPAIFTIEDAIKNNSFYPPERKAHYGNVDEAFKACDQILEGQLHVGGQEQFYMETNTALVVPKEDKEMDIYLSTQSPSSAQQMVCRALGVPSNRVSIHTKRIGGGFGGKLTKATPFACATAVAANKIKLPVRCILERDVDMLMTAGRHPFLGKYKVGFMNDGRILAVDILHYSNAGCTFDESILVIVIALLKMDNGYRFPNLRVRGRACKTNLPSNTGFRGFGFPQTGVVTETLVDAVALKCGLPSEKVREINMHKGTSSETFYKQTFDATNLTRCWDECMEKSSYLCRRSAIQEYNKQNYWKKKGIAIIPLKFSVGFIDGSYHQAGAFVNIFLDGSVLVTHGGVEMGQGVHTKVSQIASRVLKIPLSKVYICETCTTTVPNTCPSGGSIGTDVNGMAVKSACETLLERLQPVISSNPTGKWEEWIGAAFASKISLSATGFFNGYDSSMNWETGEGHVTPYYVFGAACSEVETDCLTGDHKIIRSDIVMDIGASINPGVDVGQIEGAFMQGVGLYTREELKYSPAGSLYTRGPDQYKIPAVADIPEKFFVYLLASSKNPYTIYSSKGVGEPSLFLGCSVYFAIKDAIDAARKERKLQGSAVTRTPLSAERIRMACSDNITNMIPKDAPETFTPWAINV
ncbi:aldehyde oxidase 1-like isoform X2 [Pleurodeles waltl]|uniref:aldehyde oxidase 1-like isoform X2 n=1 Tax=Pleurodeles waltl TaxID=8319 RepID=UPI003709C4D1